MTIDWQEVFGLTVSPLELIIRGSAIYVFLFVIFRFILRRDVGSVGMADVLVIVIIADASQNGMSGDYKSVTDGAILIGTIVAWNILIDFVAFKSERLRRLMEPGKLLLIQDGRFIAANLRREFLAKEEVMAKLRENNIEHVSDVKLAYLESDGSISVIPIDKKQ